MLRASLASVCWVLFFSLRVAAADVAKRDVYDLPTPVAVQGRTNNIDQGVSLSAGLLVGDSFNRGLPISLAYSFYFRPYLSWEAVSYAYNINVPTKMRQDFVDLGTTSSSIGLGGRLDFPKSILMTGVVYTPLYGKSLLFGKSLVHSETSFYLGIGSMTFGASGTVPVIAPGLQGRYFLTRKSALRYYLRQYLFKDVVQGFTTLTDIGIGYEMQFDLISKNTSSDDDEDE